MSKIYKDTDIEFVKLTLKLKSNPASTVIVYAGLDYYEVGELYSGSPEIQPLLAESPNVIRSVGDHIGVRHTVSVRLFSRQPFPIYPVNKGLTDLRPDYEFYRAKVEFYYGAKPHDAQGVASDFVIKQDTEVVTADWDDESLTLNCRDIWYEDKEVSFRIPDETVITVWGGQLGEQYIGEYAPIPFGANQVVESFVYDVNSVNTVYLLAGFNWDADHTVKDHKEWYVENRTKDLSPDNYIRVDDITNPLYGTAYGLNGLASSTPFHLGEFWRSTFFTPSSGCFLVAFQVTISVTGTASSVDGVLTFELYRGKEFTTAGTTPPTGSPLTQFTYDAQDAGGAFPGRTFNFETPIPLVGGQPYTIVAKFSSQDATNYVNMHVLASGPESHDALDRTTEDAGWVLQSGVRSSIVPLALIPGTITQESENGFYFNRVDLNYSTTLSASKAINGAGGYSHQYLVDGLKDNAAGTFTGTANALMEIPADLLHFTLVKMLDVDSSLIDTASFNSVRSSQNAETYRMGYVIDRDTNGEELIVEMCRQSRMVLYKEAGGKYKVHFWEPSPAKASVDNTFSQPQLRDELKVVSIQDEPINRVFNTFSQNWKNNALQFPTDPKSTRRSRTDKFLENQFLNQNDSTSGDTSRENAMADSVALYGERVMDFPLDMHTDATGVQNLQNYYASRFKFRQQLITVEIPRRIFYNRVDLLESGLVQSDQIGDDLGYMTAEGVRDVGTATFSASVTNYPGVGFNFGEIKGIVTAVEETGPFIRVTINTDEGPGSY